MYNISAEEVAQASAEDGSSKHKISTNAMNSSDVEFIAFNDFTGEKEKIIADTQDSAGAFGLKSQKGYADYICGSEKAKTGAVLEEDDEVEQFLHGVCVFILV